jgi:phospholipase/carboxylesterase
VIWMHGLGADAGDMIGLVNELQVSIPLRHVFLDAPVRPVTLNNGMSMRAWYDITGMKLTDREDKVGIFESEAFIRKVIEKQVLDGFSPETIFLAGFSQGGAMALFTGLHTVGRLGGLIVLSGYLPLAAETQLRLDTNTPMFFASGEYDPLVLPAWTGQCVTYLQERGYQQVVWHRYPMEHSICIEEVQDLQQWISSALTREA